MGSPYAQSAVSRGGSGYSYSGAPGKSKKKKKKKGGGAGGVLGFAEHLGSDALHAVEGLALIPYQVPLSGWKAVIHQDPHELLKPLEDIARIPRVYAQTYGPLFHGDIRKFGHQFYEHPLQPILDAATVATLGAGAGVRAGLLPAAAREIELASPAARVGAGTAKVSKAVTGTDFSRYVKIQVSKALDKLPAHYPGVGAHARWARQVAKLGRRDALALSHQSRHFHDAMSHLDVHERTAVNVLAGGVHPHDLTAMWEKTGALQTRPELADALTNPKIVHLVENPPPKVLRAVEEGQKLDQLNTKLLTSRGWMHPETATARRGMHQRVAAEILSPPHDFSASLRSAAEGRGFSAEEIDRAVESFKTKPKKEAYDDVYKYTRGGKPGERKSDWGTVKWNGKDAQYGRKETLARIGMKAVSEKPEPNLSILKPTPTEPFYVPDKPIESNIRSFTTGKGGGRGVQRSPVHQSEGVLFRMGQLALHPDLLTPEFLKNVKTAHYEDLHNALLDGGMEVSKEHLHAMGGLPKGWEFVPKPIRTKTGSIKAQHIPYTVKTAGEHLRSLEPLGAKVPEPFPGGKVRGAEEALDEQALAERGLSTSDPREAYQTPEGDYVIVPKKAADALVGEFTRASSAVKAILENPTKVWRSIILGYRLGFLTNNVLGNHLMYAIKQGGVHGLAGYLDAVKGSVPAARFRTMLGQAGKDGLIDEAFVARHFPDQLETFGSTQKPRFQSPRAQKLARRAATGIIPGTQAVAEGFLRRATISAETRRVLARPEVKSVISRADRDIKTISDKADVAFKDNPKLIDQIAQGANDTLGDYVNMTPLERNGVRSVIPFYAWYKAITLITLKMPLDNPVRTSLLAKLGQMQEERNQQDLGPVPGFLEGSIPLSRHGDLQTALSMHSLNPYMSSAQVATTLKDLLTGHPGQAASTFGSELNPFIGGTIEQLTGSRLFSGGKVPQYLPGLPGNLLANIILGLPQVQMATATPSQLYPTKGSLLYGGSQFAGLPIKTYSRKEAAARARGETTRKKKKKTHHRSGSGSAYAGS